MTAPVLLSAYGFNTEAAPKIELQFDQNLDASSPPATGCFAVKLNGVAKTVTAVVMTGDQYLDLTISEPLPVSGAGVTVDYTDPGTANSIRNAGNEHTASFTGHTLSSGFIGSGQATLSHIYAGSSGTIELPTALSGGQYETSQSQVRVLIARGTILQNGTHIWVYVDGVANTDVAGSISAGSYSDTLTATISGLSAGVHTFHVQVIGPDSVVYEDDGPYSIKQADGTAVTHQFLLDNFVGADATALTTGHTGETGATWAISSQSALAASDPGTEGHKLHLGALWNNANTSFTHAYVYPSANPSLAAYAYEFDITRDAGTSGYTAARTSLHAYLGLDNTTDTYYRFNFNFVTVGAAVVLQLFYQVRINGSDIVNATLANQAFSAGAHSFRVDVSDVDGWSVKMDGATLVSGSDYLLPAASQNLIFQFNSFTSSRLVTLDAVRGYDTPAPVTYPVASMDPMEWGQASIVAAMVSMEPVTMGEPSVLLPARAVRAGIKLPVFGKPIGPNNKLRKVSSGIKATRMGTPTAFHLV